MNTFPFGRSRVVACACLGSALWLAACSASPSPAAELSPAAPSPAAPLPASATLRIELSVPQPVVAVNSLVAAEAYLVNDHSEPIEVVLPGDGSDCGWRTPVVKWQPPLPERERCGNINSLEATDVVTLGPGQRVKLVWIGRLEFDTPGRHQLQLRIEHDPEMKWSGLPLGRHNSAAMARVRQITPFVAVSNEVEIEVKGQVKA